MSSSSNMNQTPHKMNRNHHEGEEIALRLGTSVDSICIESNIDRSWAHLVEGWLRKVAIIGWEEPFFASCRHFLTFPWEILRFRKVLGKMSNWCQKHLVLIGDMSIIISFPSFEFKLWKIFDLQKMTFSAFWHLNGENEDQGTLVV